MFRNLAIIATLFVASLGYAASTYTTPAGTNFLTGLNSFNGTIQINSGSNAYLWGNNNVSNSANIKLNGGTLGSNTYNDTFGTLTLSSSSTIDMSHDYTDLTFANSRNIGWTGTLTVANWGTWGNSGNTTDHLNFGANGLNAQQIAQIKFTNPYGMAAGTYDARLLSNGDVVPVPEPATMGIGALLMGLAGFNERRRKNATKKA